MANVFGILTAIVLALSAFIAFKNKSSYEAMIAEAATQKQNLETSQKRLESAQNTLNAAMTKSTDELDAEIANLIKETADSKKANEDMKLLIETQTAKVSENKEQLDEVRTKTEQVGDLKELGNKMRQAESEREEVVQAVSQLEAKLANLIAQARIADEQANTIRAKLDGLNTGLSVPSLNTRIRSIYPSWGFVTLAAGNDSGIISNSTLNVVRGDETVAQLLVTTVERGSASASIVPDSLASGVTLRVGDRVVAATKSETKDAAVSTVGESN